MKGLIRDLVNTRVYKMSTEPTVEFAEVTDPANDLLHRMRVKRLEGEVIRDSVLAVSGGLDRTMFGPSVAMYLSPYMGGLRRPSSSVVAG